MRSLGDTLKSYLNTQRTQTEVVLGWLEHFEKKGKTWSLEMIEKSLDLCLNDQTAGTRFFFDELERAMVLLELLGVPTADRMDLFELADHVIVSGGRQTPRLVIDASTWGSAQAPADQMFLAVKRQFVDPLPLSPAILLVIPSQYEKIPRSWSVPGPQFKVERVASIEAAWERVKELARDQPLVVSARRHEVFERWVAGRFDGKQIGLEPADGLEQFAQNGSLPSLPPVAHNLETLVGSRPLPQVKLPGNPLELRKLMVKLRTEEGAEAVKLAPEVRLACARQLGLEVTSTAKERLEADPPRPSQPVKLEVKAATDQEPAAPLDPAKGRFVPLTALKVDNQVPLVNPAHEQGVAAPAGIQVHNVPNAPALLSRLLEEIEQWSGCDYAEDPGLLHAIDRLDPAGTERLEFLHARAGLLWSDALKPQPARREEDWRGGLERLLSAPPPAADLRIRGRHNKDKYKGWAQPVMFMALDQDPARGQPAKVGEALNRMSPEVRRQLSVLPTRTGFTVGRKDRLTVNSYHKKWYGDFVGGATSVSYTHLTLPTNREV